MNRRWTRGIASLWILVGCGGAPRGEAGHAPPTEPGHVQGEEGKVELDPTAAGAAGILAAPAELRALLPEFMTTGEVDFDENKLAHVGPRTDARVVEVLVDLGATVQAGQIVAVLDSIELGRSGAAYLGARAAREVADSAFLREESLRAEKISSEVAYLAARAEQQRTRADAHAAEETLRLLGLSAEEIAALQFGSASPGRLPLRAPFAGTLVERHLQRGESVSPADTLFTVADLSSLWIWIDVYERDLPRVHLGDLATVQIPAYPDRAWTGTVTYLRDAVDRDTRTVRARIEVLNADGVLRPQMFVNVRLSDPHHEDAGSAPLVLAVPTSALQRREGKVVVYVQEAPGQYAEHAVQLGHLSAGYAEILSGLHPGDLVVVAGAFVLKTEASRGSLGGGHTH